MVASSKKSQQFILIPKAQYDNLTTTPGPPISTPPLLHEVKVTEQLPVVPSVQNSSDNAFEQSQAEHTKTTIPVREHILKELQDNLESTKPSDQSRRWKHIKAILDKLLENKQVDVQVSNLQVTVNSIPVEGIFAPNFIYALQIHQKHIPIQKYTLILQHLQLPLALVRNKQARNIIEKLSNPQAIAHQTGSGKRTHATSTQSLKRSKKDSRNKETHGSNKSTSSKTKFSWITL